MASKVQFVAGNNGAAPAATATVTFAATASKNDLVAAIMCGSAGVTITPPAGWQAASNALITNPSGGTMQAFVFPNNPGNITAVQFGLSPSALAAVLGYEITPGSGAAFPPDVVSAFSNTNAASAGVGAKVTQEMIEYAIGFIGYINNTAITVTGYPAGFTEDGNAITSAASGNAGIRGASGLFTSSPINFGGVTLSGTPSNGPDTIFISLLQYLFQLSNGNYGYAVPQLNGQSL